MKARYLYIVLIFAGLLSSCAKKKYPESAIINDTVYSFNGMIDNQQVSIAAGVNSYYMYSSYGQDINSVYNFVATLKQTDCSECRNSLKIQINDFRVSTLSGPIVMDSVFFPRSLSFISSVSHYEAGFQSQFNRTASSYLWDFGDGSTSADASPSHVYTKAGDYVVALKINSDNGCVSTIRQVKKIKTAPDNYATDIITTASSGRDITFKQLTSGGTPPYRYVWNFGDGSISSEANPLHSYAFTGSYPVSLNVTDANNNTIVAEYNAVTQSDHSSCAANYQLSAVAKQNDPLLLLGLSKIIITWTDANGIVYTSKNELQPDASHFAITSVEDGGKNENNLPLKKLHVVFNCKVYNGPDALTITNAEATIGVAYK